MEYVATLTRQKDKVEVMQERKKAAMKQLEGISWTDRILEDRKLELDEASLQRVHYQQS
jgi:hypothetical protein